jgi:ABC-type molybdate transport system permease subunit
VDLDRQELPPPRVNEPPQRVPETKPPLLGDWFIYLSVIVLFCGVIAITALELGNDLRSPIVLIPTILGAVLLAVVAADGALRTWRSAWAWLPIFGPRAVQRFLWTGVLLAVLIGSLGLIYYLLFG